MTKATDTKCAHPNCSCSVSEGEEFCSEACAEEAESASPDDRCSCQHSQCSNAMAA